MSADSTLSLVASPVHPTTGPSFLAASRDKHGLLSQGSSWSRRSRRNTLAASDPPSLQRCTAQAQHRACLSYPGCELCSSVSSAAEVLPFRTATILVRASPKHQGTQSTKAPSSTNPHVAPRS
ncbi:hypothetical protein SUNI508_09656 [Seiridium unicorne]|uniref:Uncharacterized protein n=1 Tax=Seiridium unicorne TaxID=138068 RepID=A0ABR2UQ90_9PEZI